MIYAKEKRLTMKEKIDILLEIFGRMTDEEKYELLAFGEKNSEC
jgi:hypothetical protein